MLRYRPWHNHPASVGPQTATIAARIATAGLTTPAGDPADSGVVAEMLVGPIFHRWLLRTAPLDDTSIDTLVAHVVG